MDRTIIKLCNEGNLEELKKLNIKDKIDFDITFRYAMAENKLDIIEWIYSLKPNIIYSYPEMLSVKCMSVKSNESILEQKNIINILNWLYKFYKNPYYDFYNIFCYVCESGNLLIAQWLYSKFKYEIRLNRLNKINNQMSQYDFLNKIISSNNIEMLLWLDTLNIKYNNSVLNSIFNNVCILNKLHYIPWLLNKRQNYYIKTPVIESIKQGNHIELSNIFQTLYPNYYHRIIDNKIISIKFLTKIQKDTAFNNEKYIIKEKIDECLICFEKNDYNIKLECKHLFCRDCYIELKKCPMCLRQIDDTKIILIKNIV